VLRNLPARLEPDTFAFTAIATLLVGIAITASSIPAFRVSRVNPVTVLRHE
jgi:ABC-type lipoprotein release transport system permease subunit